jgi:hypothetical protein
VNRLQKAAARATGLTDVLEYQSDELTRVVAAAEETVSQLALLERKYDELNYINVGDVPSPDKDVLPAAKRRQIIRRLRIMRHENPIAKQAVKLILRFTLGRGITFVPKDPESQQILHEFWTDAVNEMILTTRESMQARLDELVTDGEKFYALFATPNQAPYVRLGEVPMEEVVDIIPDPDNRHVPVYYKRQYVPQKYDASAFNGQGAWTAVDSSYRPLTRYYLDYRVSDEHLARIENLNIPDSLIAKDENGDYIRVMHQYINPLWTKSGFRGISELFASREWFRVFKEFVEDRAAMNAAANAISYLRKVKGGPTAVAQVSGKIGGVAVGQEQAGSNELRKLTRPVPGSIIDTNEGVDWSTIRADTGALDAKEDARLLLMTGGAGMATNVQYFGEGGDANLATAQAMELPMVKSYEDWQQTLQEHLNQICKYVLMIAHGAADMTELDEEVTRIAWQFPPIVTEDVVKYTTAWAQVAQQVAPGNLVVKEIAIRGALNSLQVPNLEGLMSDIQEEEKRVETEKQAQKEFMNQQFAAGAVGNGAPKPPQNGQKPPENGQKAGDGGGTVPLGPDLQRIANGRPPRIPASGPRG